MTNLMELYTVLLLFLATAFHSVYPQAIGTDCNGKTFLCLDDVSYQACSQASGGQTQTTDTQVTTCGTSQYCSNSDQNACSSTTPSPSTTTTQASTSSTTSSSTTTTQSTSTTDASSTQSTSSPSSTTTTTSTTTEKPYYCEQTGKYPHNTDCHRYYLCVVLPFASFELDETCLFDQVFDPSTQKCTSDQSKCQLQQQPFTCTSAGRFPDPSDTVRYFQCSWNASSSSYELHKCSCLFGYPFDANRGKCSGFFGI